jgi:hypothetical protein
MGRAFNRTQMAADGRSRHAKFAGNVGQRALAWAFVVSKTPRGRESVHLMFRETRKIVILLFRQSDHRHRTIGVPGLEPLDHGTAPGRRPADDDGRS